MYQGVQHAAYVLSQQASSGATVAGVPAPASPPWCQCAQCWGAGCPSCFGQGGYWHSRYWGPYPDCRGYWHAPPGPQAPGAAPGVAPYTPGAEAPSPEAAPGAAPPSATPGQEGAAPEAAPPVSSVAAAPTTTVPGMIGDSLSAGCTRVLATRSLAKHITIHGTGAPAPYRATILADRARLLSNAPLVIDGDNPGVTTVGPPVEFLSEGSFPTMTDPRDLPPGLQLEENDSVSQGLEIEYPDSVRVEFNEAYADNKQEGVDPGTGQPVVDYNVFMDYTVVDMDICIPQGAPGSAIGRSKIAEDTSPIPQDRFIFDYSYFSGAKLIKSGIDVHRFTPGFEKTYFGGRASLQMKIPMAVTLDNNFVADDAQTGVSSAEFGNISYTFKHLVWTAPHLSLGLDVTIPTADDVRVRKADGTPLLRVENESVYVAPFFGWYHEPCQGFFFHGFLQWDIDTCGSTLHAREVGGPLVKRGKLTDTTVMYTDAGLGWWVHQACSPCEWLQGLALTSEVHWTAALQDPDVMVFNDFLKPGDTVTYGDPNQTIDTLNMTVGAHILCQNDTRVTVAYIFPLDSDGRRFDGELRLVVNRYFGISALGRSPRARYF